MARDRVGNNSFRSIQNDLQLHLWRIRATTLSSSLSIPSSAVRLVRRVIRMCEGLDLFVYPGTLTARRPFRR